jgi:hypothetical protein
MFARKNYNRSVWGRLVTSVQRRLCAEIMLAKGERNSCEIAVLLTPV